MRVQWVVGRATTPRNTVAVRRCDAGQTEGPTREGPAAVLLARPTLVIRVRIAPLSGLK